MDEMDEMEREFNTDDSGIDLTDWIPVCEKLGKERTIKLIRNGTQLEVALQMIKFYPRHD